MAQPVTDMTFDEAVQEILDAEYGEDVRDAIHDACCLANSGTGTIGEGGIQSYMLGGGVVTNDKIANGTIDGLQKIAENSITSSRLHDDCIYTRHIEDGQVIEDHLEESLKNSINGAIEQARKLYNPSNNSDVKIVEKTTSLGVPYIDYEIQDGVITSAMLDEDLMRDLGNVADSVENYESNKNDFIRAAMITFALEHVTGNSDVDITFGTNPSTGAPVNATLTIKALAVDTAELANSAVTNDKIANSAVVTAKIADEAITTAKIADGNVTTVKIADGAITAEKLAEGAISGSILDDNSVFTRHIVDAAVTSDKIAKDAVTTNKIINGAIVSDKILNNAITTAKIANGNVTTDKIANGAITAEKIADGVISFAIPDEAITTAKIADGNVTTAKIANSAVATAKIADGNVTTAKIADEAVTTAKIADGAVITSKIPNDAIITTKLSDRAVTTAKIFDSAITTAKIADGNVTTAKIADGNVTTIKIADEAVTTAKIADANVTTAKIADDNVTESKLATALLEKLLPSYAWIAVSRNKINPSSITIDNPDPEVPIADQQSAAADALATAYPWRTSGGTAKFATRMDSSDGRGNLPYNPTTYALWQKGKKIHGELTFESPYDYTAGGREGEARYQSWFTVQQAIAEEINHLQNDSDVDYNTSGATHIVTGATDSHYADIRFANTTVVQLERFVHGSARTYTAVKTNNVIIYIDEVSEASDDGMTFYYHVGNESWTGVYPYETAATDLMIIPLTKAQYDAAVVEYNSWDDVSERIAELQAQVDPLYGNVIGRIAKRAAFVDEAMTEMYGSGAVENIVETITFTGGFNRKIVLLPKWRPSHLPLKDTCYTTIGGNIYKFGEDVPISVTGYINSNGTVAFFVDRKDSTTDLDTAVYFQKINLWFDYELE